MRCSTHVDLEATAICIHCGKALCSSCATKSASGRTVCSPACAGALFTTEQAINSIQQKAISSGRTAGYLLLVCGLVFGVYSVIPLFDGHWQIAVLCLPMALIFVIIGFSRLRSSK
jgi:hypothetical protein